MPYLLIDAHVHLHGDVLTALRAAAANLAKATARADAVGVLLLAEIAGTDRFGALRAEAERGDTALTIAGAGCLWWCGAPQLPLLLIAGRQVVTAERIELLVLGTERMLDDGIPLDAGLRWCDAVGALPVLPWGVGKWIGRRGRIVAQALARRQASGPLLGDNAGRPAFWRVPIFAEARRRGVPILPGSDPLPVRDGAAATGGFGLGMEVALDPANPRGSVLAALRAEATPRVPIGRVRPIGRILAEQLALRLPHARMRATA